MLLSIVPVLSNDQLGRSQKQSAPVTTSAATLHLLPSRMRSKVILLYPGPVDTNYRFGGLRRDALITGASALSLSPSFSQTSAGGHLRRCTHSDLIELQLPRRSLRLPRHQQNHCLLCRQQSLPQITACSSSTTLICP